MPFLNLSDIKPKEIIEGYRARIINGDKMTVVYWEVKAGSPLPEHSHPQEQISNMLDGKYELTVDGEAKVMEPGDVALIPSNVSHSGKAITDCIIIDLFHPIREY